MNNVEGFVGSRGQFTGNHVLREANLVAGALAKFGLSIERNG